MSKKFENNKNNIKSLNKNLKKFYFTRNKKQLLRPISYKTRF